MVYAAVLLPVFQPAGAGLLRAAGPGSARIAVIIGSYALADGVATSRFLNISSLHMFYKARIVRGYLGAANARRLGASPTDQVSGLLPPQVPVGEVDAHDDISQLKLRAAPRMAGRCTSPTSASTRRTTPSRSCSTATARACRSPSARCGWMQAGGAPWAQAHGDGALTLGAWTAISGAAFAPGLGRLTKRGIAALVGVRGSAAGLLVEQRRGRHRCSAARSCTRARC